MPDSSSIRDLLAVIHRDGGQRVDEIGPDAAIAEAIEIVQRLGTEVTADMTRRLIEAWMDLGTPIDEREHADHYISDEIAARVIERAESLPAWTAEHRNLAAIEPEDRTADQRERLRELASKIASSPDAPHLQGDPVLAKLAEIERRLGSGI